MSLLDQITLKKRQLTHTETVVTLADGRRYLECKNKRSDLDPCHGYVVDTKPDDIPALVADNLYLGSQDCCDVNVLSKYDITAVLSIGVDAPIKHDGILYEFVECLDLPETNLMPTLNKCIDFIEAAIRQQRNLLVHCNAGVSRSASVVVGYLMIKCGMPYSEAFNTVRLARSCVRPNAGFEAQLRALEQTLNK